LAATRQFQQAVAGLNVRVFHDGPLQD